MLCVVTGLLPAAEAEQNIRRILPLLLFLASVIVLANLARDALVFDVIATRLAITGRGSYAALFLLCVAFASVTTILLNLDTTAVLLTPVLLALAARAGIAALPLAMTTIWLANTASLLLPVSNLTNLLAADRIALTAPAFAARMWAPQLASIAATMLFLWVFYWRRGRRGADRYTPPVPVRLGTARERTLFRVTGAACLLFVAAIPFIREQIGARGRGRRRRRGDRLRRARPLPPAAAPRAVAAAGLRDRAVPGGPHAQPVRARRRDDRADRHRPRPGGRLPGGRGGCGLSNVLNNLPAYVAGEAVIPPGNDRPCSRC